MLIPWKVALGVNRILGHRDVAGEAENSGQGSMLSLRVIARGMGAEECVCTQCESRYVRVSRRRAPWFLRIFSLMLVRCESCRGLFVLPRRLGSRLLDSRDYSGA